MPITLGTEGEVHYNRFIIPHGINEKELCLFSIIDLHETRGRGESDLSWRAQQFGVSWNEDHSRFTQIFGYRVATMSEMERIGARQGKDEGGYYYVCYKLPLQQNKREFLCDSGLELLGWTHYSSRYMPCAKDEAMTVTYHLARDFGLKTRERLSKTLEIVIPERDITFEIEWKTEHDQADKIVLELFDPVQKGMPFYD